MLDYFVGSGLKGLIYGICMYVSMYVQFCHVLYVLFVYCMYLYVYIYVYVYLYVCIYMYVLRIVYLYVCIYVCLSVYKDASLYVCVGTHFCLHKIYLVNCLSCRYLGCYLSVWHCYLGCILAFSFKIVKLNTTTCTNPLLR